MNGSHQRPLIERRRRHPGDHGELTCQPDPPHNRRADDPMRIRSQHWIELADVALSQKSIGPQHGNNR